MKINEYDIEKLVQIIIEVLIRKKITPNLNTDELKFTRDKNNIWHVISLKFSGSDDSKFALRIYTWWTRNNYKIREKVSEKLNENAMDHESNILFETNFDLIFQIDIDDWLQLYKTQTSLVYATGRRRFKIGFDHFLNNLINRDCWYKSKSNWFRQTNSRKTNSPFWSGNFVCIKEDCLNEICAFINEIDLNGKQVDIKIREIEKHFLHEKIYKKEHIKGIERTQLAKSIKAHGLQNIRNENIIMNMENNDQRSIIKRMQFLIFKSNVDYKLLLF
jgi:hypothetical protein